MKKLERLDNSKFKKFESSKIQNLDNIKGGYYQTGENSSDHYETTGGWCGDIDSWGGGDGCDIKDNLGGADNISVKGDTTNDSRIVITTK